jgi:hypothetical protein
LFEMQNAADRNYSDGFVPDEIYRVREALRRGQSVRPNSLTKELGRIGDHSQFVFNALDEHVTETGGTFLIPHEILTEIRLRLRRNNEADAHSLRSSRVFTSGQDEPSVGFA